jgi:hypothetical protein
MAFLSRGEKGYFKFVIFIKISQLFDQLQKIRYIADIPTPRLEGQT